MNQMCANPYKGEVTLVINGQEELLRLNLGALAYLETLMKLSSIGELIERFGGAKYTSEDIICVLKAGFYGANARHIDIKNATIEGGAKAAAVAAICLLKLAFEVQS